MSKYQRDLKGQQVDVYDVLKAFNVTCPALQHLIKKALCCGLRGHKDQAQDLQDIVDSAVRAQELTGEKPSIDFIQECRDNGIDIRTTDAAPPPPPPKGPGPRDPRGVTYGVNDTWADGWNR